MMFNKTTVLNHITIEELKVRTKIGLFIILVLQLSLYVYPPIKTVWLMMIIASLVDIGSMVVINRFCGLNKIGRDINELGVYAVILHIIEVPVFYYTSISSDYHNNGIWVLLILAIARLFYFGEKSFSAFGLLAHAQKLYAKRTQFKYLSEVLFFGAAIPLWYIMYRTNDQKITITVIGVMLFIYIMTDAIKTQAEAVKAVVLEPESNPDAVSASAPDAVSALLLKIFNEKSEDEKAWLMKLIAIDHDFIAVEPEVDSPRNEDEALLLDGYARKYYYPLGKLMQLLPGDITNRSSLTAEQANKCLALCGFAEKACAEIKSGLLMIELLQEMATVSKIRRPIPDCEKLIAHLEIELEFFQQCISDYGGAARHIEKVWPTTEDGKRRRSHPKK